MKGKNGFTAIELLMAVLIIGILANIAIPNFVRARRAANASRVVSDFRSIRGAAIVYRLDTGEFPKDYGAGKMPKELEELLPENFSFDLRPGLDVRYNWENWELKNKAKHPKTGILYGVSVTTKNKALAETIAGIYAGPFMYSLGNNYTFVIEFARE